MKLGPWPLIIGLNVMGCDSAADKGSDDGAADDSAAPVDTGDPIADYPAYDGTCPELVDGWNEGFMSAGQERKFILELPEDPTGAGVLFTWHWLGGNANAVLRALGYDDLGTRENIIVVSPSSCCDSFEWQFMSEPEGNVDLALFDDVLSCLDQQFAVDRHRVWATGFSAGALWTTYLTIHRADVLASTAIFSGGTDPVVDYSTPSEPLPVLLTWGGPDDLYAVLSFEDATAAFETSLRADGSFVAMCEHDGGHTLPDGAGDYGLAFLTDHPKHVEPEPYAQGLPETLPDICFLPED